MEVEREGTHIDGCEEGSEIKKGKVWEKETPRSDANTMTKTKATC